MLFKKPKSKLTKILFRGGKILIAAEIGCFVLSYLGWRELNHNQDLRYYMYKNHNWLLESYYQVGERLSSDSRIRQFDIDCWKSDGKSL